MGNFKGQFNSSITRVRPVFQELIHREDTSWFGDLVNLFPNQMIFQINTKPVSICQSSLQRRSYHDKILKQYKIETIQLENCFEFSLPPSNAFLKWLIENPDQLQWPNGQSYGEPTQLKRRALLDGDKNIQSEALQALAESGAEKSSKKWWAFEGFTEVDCLIETDTLILAIEGKRTEKGPSAGVNWYPARNQIVRNLESVKRYAGDKPFAVILIDEKNSFELTQEIINDSLPHLSAKQRTELVSHYLGSTTWKNVCEATGIDYASLPDKTEDVVKTLLKNLDIAFPPEMEEERS